MKEMLANLGTHQHENWPHKRLWCVITLSLLKSHLRGLFKSNLLPKVQTRQIFHLADNY
jgi:hypothetical protein